MIDANKILIDAELLKAKKLDVNDPFFIKVMEAVKREQEELNTFNKFDYKQLLTRVTI